MAAAAAAAVATVATVADFAAVGGSVNILAFCARVLGFLLD